MHLQISPFDLCLKPIYEAIKCKLSNIPKLNNQSHLLGHRRYFRKLADEIVSLRTYKQLEQLELWIRLTIWRLLTGGVWTWEWLHHITRRTSRRPTYNCHATPLLCLQNFMWKTYAMLKLPWNSVSHTWLKPNLIILNSYCSYVDFFICIKWKQLI